MSAVSGTIMMANSSGDASAATQSDSFSSKSPPSAHNSNSVSTVDGTNVSTNQKSQLTTPEPNISGNLSSNSSINSASMKSGGSKTAEMAVKRKALSSSRQKKFHRHFPQVAADEEVINCKLATLNLNHRIYGIRDSTL